MFDQWMWGMHGAWWIVWIVVVIVAVAYIARDRTIGTNRPPPSTPLEILQRRYASGDISTEEYRERKAELLR